MRWDKTWDIREDCRLARLGCCSGHVLHTVSRVQHGYRPCHDHAIGDVAEVEERGRDGYSRVGSVDDSDVSCLVIASGCDGIYDYRG